MFTLPFNSPRYSCFQVAILSGGLVIVVQRSSALAFCFHLINKQWKPQVSELLAGWPCVYVIASHHLQSSWKGIVKCLSPSTDRDRTTRTASQNWIFSWYIHKEQNSESCLRYSLSVNGNEFIKLGDWRFLGHACCCWSAIYNTTLETGWQRDEWDFQSNKWTTYNNCDAATQPYAVADQRISFKWTNWRDALLNMICCV